jgi:hypothetical protein
VVGDDVADAVYPKSPIQSDRAVDVVGHHAQAQASASSAPPGAGKMVRAGCGSPVVGSMEIIVWILIGLLTALELSRLAAALAGPAPPSRVLGPSNKDLTAERFIDLLSAALDTPVHRATTAEIHVDGACLLSGSAPGDPRRSAIDPSVRLYLQA